MRYHFIWLSTTIWSNKSFSIFETIKSEKFEVSKCQIYVFSRTNRRKTEQPFLIHNFHSTGSLGYQFDSLSTLLWTDKISPLLKICKAKKSKFQNVRPIFCLGQLREPPFLIYSLHTTGSLGYQFILLSTTLSSHAISLFLKL